MVSPFCFSHFNRSWVPNTPREEGRWRLIEKRKIGRVTPPTKTKSYTQPDEQSHRLAYHTTPQNNKCIACQVPGKKVSGIYHGTSGAMWEHKCATRGAISIRQRAAWASTLINHKHAAKKRKKRGGKTKQKRSLCATPNSLPYTCSSWLTSSEVHVDVIAKYKRTAVSTGILKVRVDVGSPIPLNHTSGITRRNKIQNTRERHTVQLRKTRYYDFLWVNRKPRTKTDELRNVQSWVSAIQLVELTVDLFFYN